MSDVPFTRADLIARGRALLEQIDAGGGGVFEVKEGRMANRAHAPTVHGISRHALRVAPIVFELYERGLTLEAMPLVRTAYEFAVTAQWAADSREGIFAIYNEELRNRRALAATMRQSASKVFQEAAPDVDPTDWERIDTVADVQGRRFSERCVALASAGHHAYGLYRAMSAFCHPSASLADHYLQADDSQAGARLCWDPDQFDHDSWLFLTVASVVWAARAIDNMNRDHPNRELLRGAAHDLGIPDVLRLTPEAFAAEGASGQARRRAQWKGRRKKAKADKQDRGAT